MITGLWGEFFKPGEKSGRAPLQCAPATQHVCIRHTHQVRVRSAVETSRSTILKSTAPYQTELLSENEALERKLR